MLILRTVTLNIIKVPFKRSQEGFLSFFLFLYFLAEIDKRILKFIWNCKAQEQQLRPSWWSWNSKLEEPERKLQWLRQYSGFKDRKFQQQNSPRSPETDAQKGQCKQWGKDALPSQVQIHMGQNGSQSSPHTIHKTISRWTEDSNEKGKTTRLSKENVTEHLCDPEVSMFLK